MAEHSRRVFDETSLHEAIIKTWGEHGAHNDVFTAMRHHLRSVEAENEQLRDALGVILAGLTDALGDPMGARPSQVTTLYSIASHALRPIQSGSSGGEG